MSENTTNPSNSQPDLNELMKKAQEIQQKMKWAQTKLTSIQVTGSAGGSAVEITVNGQRKITSVKIDKSFFTADMDIKVLEELIAAAGNDAMTKIEKISQEEMMKLAKEFGLPEDTKY